MNIVRLRRLTVHMFFSATLLIFFATPVFAVTLELANTKNQSTVPLTEPLSLTTPKPTKGGDEVMGPEKPEEKETTKPTPTKTSAPSNTPTPSTSKTEPTPTEAPTTAPTRNTQAAGNTSTGGLNADALFSMSNNYRAGLGLAPFQTDERICSLAAARAPEIAAEIAGGYMHAGKDSHSFPYRFTENIITMRSEAEAFNWWVNDYIHRVQIEQNNTHSCVACQGNACTQLFTSFQPK
jgi:uncharacterized protein YkwD